MSPYEENINLFVSLFLENGLPIEIQKATLQTLLLNMMRLYENSETKAVANAMIEKKFITDLKRIA